MPFLPPNQQRQSTALETKKNLPKKFIYSYTTASKSKTKELTVSGLQQ